MLGASESHAESIGGALKRFPKSLSTGRVVESTILRSAGFSGCGGGGEDGLICSQAVNSFLSSTAI